MTKILLSKKSKNLLALLLLLISLWSWGQINNSNLLQQSSTNVVTEQQKELDNAGNIMELMQGKEEVVSQRDAFSKHFRNSDGSITAIIGADAIHYKKEGRFLDIDLTIIPNSDNQYTFANTSNIFETYFGKTTKEGLKNRTHEEEVKEFLNTKMYWEVNGQPTSIQSSSEVEVSVNKDKAIYQNLYGRISAEFMIMSGKRKLNYIIPDREALGDIPADADYLVFAEDIILPSGWTYEVTESGIIIKDNNNQKVYIYENPNSFDVSGLSLLRDANTIFETFSDRDILTIKTKVKVSWLLNAQREFPVRIDPTLNAQANASVSVYSDGENETTGYYGRIAGYWLQYHIKFNTTSIPIGSTLSAVTGYIYQYGTAGSRHASSNWAWVNSADPTTTTGTTLYNSATALQSTSVNTNMTINVWKNSVFTAAGRTYVKNGIDNLGYVAAAVYPGGTWNNNNYLGNRTHTDTEKPYLAITYTEPAVAPSCATIVGPANTATGIAHQGSLVWNSVAGATGYDVYFGTSSTPPIVSTNQSATNYAIPFCLEPEKTYYWKVIPKNANGAATGCSTWSFTTDNKLHIYSNNWETANNGYFGTSGTSVDGWFTNNNIGTGGSATLGYNNTWTIGNGPNAVSGKSAGVSALYNGGLAGNFFQYYSDLGEIHRWIYRPFDMRGYRDIEVSFRWKSGGENNQDYGSVITSINSGDNWLLDTQGGLYNDGRYWDSPSTIRSQSITFPTSRNNQQNFVLGFKWDDLSGNGFSLDPSFVVDDIVIKACPYEGDILSNVVGQGIYEWSPTSSSETTLTINGSHPCAQFQWEQSTDGGNTWINAIGGSGSTTVAYTTPTNLTEETWYRCKVYFGSGCTGVYQAESFKILFGDCGLSTTWNGLTWSNGEPNSLNKKIIFTGDYNSTSNPNNSGTLEGCSIEVKNNADVIIASNHNVIIDNEIKIENGSHFTLKTDANLIQNNSADVTNVGDIYVERFVQDIDNDLQSRMDYIYWSTPVDGQELKAFSQGTPNNRFYVYNESDDYFLPANPTSPFIKGKGYAIRAEEKGTVVGFENLDYYDKTYIFQGVPNNGDIGIEIARSPNTGTNGDVVHGFNLVGNPYPSNISFDELYLANMALIYNTAWFWTNNTYAITQEGGDYEGNNYAIYNGAGGNAPTIPEGSPEYPEGIIKVGQGFIIQKKNFGTHELEFKNNYGLGHDLRVTTDGTFFSKGTTKNRFWIKLISPHNIVNTQLIGYISGATDGFEQDFDAEAFSLSSDLFYSVLDDRRLLIQGKSDNFSKDDKIRLGANIFYNGNYTIALDKTEGIFNDAQDIYLQDNLLDTVTNLKQNNYTFNASKGITEGRFEIIYKPKSTLAVTDVDKSDLLVYRNGNSFIVESARKDITTLEIYDVSGKLLKKINARSKKIIIDATEITKGMYILKISRDKEIINRKIMK